MGGEAGISDQYGIPETMCSYFFTGRYSMLASEGKRKRNERSRIRWLKWKERKKQQKSLEQMQILDVDSSEVSIVEQEVVSSDQSHGGENPQIFRVRRTEELVSCGSGSPGQDGSSGVVLISSDSEHSDNQNPLTASSPELDQRLLLKPQIPFRIRSTQELVDDVRWRPPRSPSPPFHSRDMRNHCSNAPNSLTAPIGQPPHSKNSSSSGSSRSDQSSGEKSGIPFRIRSTAELIDGTSSLPNSPIVPGDRLSQNSGALKSLPSRGSISLLSLGVAESTQATAAENSYHVHPSDQRQKEPPKSHFPGVSSAAFDVPNRSTVPQGETLQSSLDQSSVGKSGIPFRIRTTMELRGKSSDTPVNPYDMPNHSIAVPEETLLISNFDHNNMDKSAVPFRIRTTTELMDKTSHLNLRGRPNSSAVRVEKLRRDSGRKFGENPGIPFRIRTTTELMCKAEGRDRSTTPPGEAFCIKSDQSNFEKPGIPFRIRSATELMVEVSDVSNGASSAARMLPGGLDLNAHGSDSYKTIAVAEAPKNVINSLACAEAIVTGASACLSDAKDHESMSKRLDTSIASNQILSSSSETFPGWNPEQSRMPSNSATSETDFHSGSSGHYQPTVPKHIECGRTSDLQNDDQVRSISPANQVDCPSSFPKQSDPISWPTELSIGRSAPVSGLFPPSKTRNFQTLYKKLRKTESDDCLSHSSSNPTFDRVQNCLPSAPFGPLSTEAERSGSRRAADEQRVDSTNSFFNQNDPPNPRNPQDSDTSKTALNRLMKMDVENCRSESISSFSAVEITASSKTVISTVDGMQLASQCPSKPSSHNNVNLANKLNSPCSSIPNETNTIALPDPSYFYTESATPASWSALYSNHRSRRPDHRNRRTEIMQRYHEVTSLGHRKSLADTELNDVTSGAALASGSEYLDPRVKPAKKKLGRSQKESEIIDQYNKITAKLRELNQMKKVLKTQPAHAPKIASNHASDVSPIADIKTLKLHKSRLGCIQRELVKKLKQERKRLEKLNLSSHKSNKLSHDLKSQQRLPNKHSMVTSGGESRICYVSLAGELEDDQNPPVCAPRSQTVADNYGSNYCTASNLVVADAENDGIAPLKSTTRFPTLDTTGRPASWAGFYGPSKSASSTPLTDVEAPLPDMKIRRGESHIAGQVSVGKDAAAASGSAQTPHRVTSPTVDRSEPTASCAASSDPSKTLLPAPTSDVKTVNSDRNVAPPKLPWTALSDTSWDALYR